MHTVAIGVSSFAPASTAVPTMSAPKDDPFLSSLATLQKIVGSPERAAVGGTSSTDSTADQLKAEQTRRSQVLKRINDSLVERKNLEQSSKSTKEEWEAASEKEKELETLYQGEEQKYAEALESLKNEGLNMETRTREAESELGAVEAEAVRIELQCQELEEQIPQRESALQKAREAHQSEQSMTAATVKSLLEDLKQTRAQLKAKSNEQLKKQPTPQKVVEKNTTSEPVNHGVKDQPPVSTPGGHKQVPPNASSDDAKNPNVMQSSPTAGTNEKEVEDETSKRRRNPSPPVVHSPGARKEQDSTLEPPPKKLKVDGDWMAHSMNIQEAIVDMYKDKPLSDLADAPMSAFNGITDEGAAALSSIHLHTVRDLAAYKYFKIAQAIQTLSATEGKRLPGSKMNLDNAVDREHEGKSLKEMLLLPVSALEGLGTKASKALQAFNISTVQDLASFRHARLAEAIIQLSFFEETKTKKQRTLERALHKLD